MNDACSTDIRAVTSCGSTLSRYDSGCCSNNSHDGMLTTRALMPSAVSLVCVDAQSHLGAGCEQDDLRLAALRVGQHVGALANSRTAPYFVRSSVGMFCRLG